MWSAIIFNCVLSLITIFILHQLWDYCKVNYTYQKTKNLVEIHASKYKQIAEDIERNSTAVVAVSHKPVKLTNIHGAPPPSDFLPLDEKEWVHKELANFIDTL